MKKMKSRDDHDEKGVLINSPVHHLLFYHYLVIRIGFVNSDCQYYRLSNITGSIAYCQWPMHHQGATGVSKHSLSFIGMCVLNKVLYVMLRLFCYDGVVFYTWIVLFCTVTQFSIIVT